MRHPSRNILLLFLPSLTLCDDFDSSPPPFVSATTCSFNYPTTLPYSYDCEFAIFGTLPHAGSPITSSVAVGEEGDYGCELYPTQDHFEGKFVLLPRGECPFYEKAINAQRAGAAGLIVSDSEKEVNPVRMKGTGEEDELVMIPSIMISSESGELLRSKIRSTGAEKGVLSIEIDLDDKMDENGDVFPLNEEYELKRDVTLSEFRIPEKIMQLGAFFARAAWKETAKVYLKYAGTIIKEHTDYEMVYSIGEYFHNVEESVDEVS